MKKILLFIKNHREKRSSLKLLKESMIIVSILIVGLILILFIENLFFLTSENRKLYFVFYISFLILIFSYSIIKWIFSYFALLGNNSNEIIAKKLGDKFLNIKDRLLNIIQLNKLSPNLDLTKLAVKKLSNDLSALNKSDLSYNLHNKNLITFSILVFVSIAIIINMDLINPLNRIINYDKYYSPPLPFNLSSLNTDTEILSGDTLLITFTATGEIPDSINFHWVELKQHKSKKISKINNSYYYSFNNIKSDITYWSEVKPDFWISNWDSIGTNPNNIHVKERPEIIKTNFEITPPKYINSEPKIINNSNLNQIEVLSGSTIKLSLIANKNIQQAWMLLNDKRINLEIDKTRISGIFTFEESSTLTIFCLDENFIPNLNPTQYTLLKINDNPPLFSINLPFNEFEIDESYEININMNIMDDYGIHDVYIEYNILSPEYFSTNNSIEIWELLQDSDRGKKDISIVKNLDISDLNLSMGDEIHFWFIAKDQNNLTKSHKFIGKFPTLEDLFTKIEEYEEDNNEWIDDIQESINEIYETTQETKLDIIKNKDLSIEKEKDIEESLNKVNDIFNELEKIQENIEKIKEQAEKNNLLDQDLMEKFDHFQKLLQDMMTPELLDAMAKLQEEMKNLDQDKLLDALENFEFNVEEFETQLDRFIEMFELAKAEQKLDELNQSIQNMLDKQNTLIDKIISEPEKNKMLNSRANKQENRFSEFENLLNESKDIMESISENTLNKINTLANDDIIPSTKGKLNKTTQNLSDNNTDQAQEKAESAKNNLSDIAEEIEQIKEDFKNESMQKLTKEFILIIDNLLTISNQQENIIQKSKQVKSNSPHLQEINSEQNHINRELNQIMKAILNLSNKTFFMKPVVGRSFGKIKTSITKAISNFEQRKTSPGKKNQIAALDNLNSTIYLLLDALNEMQNSEKASGYEQFMESMQSISNQQQQINQGTMQLGQFGLMQQQNLMEQLKSQQQKLKEELSELMGEFPGENNGTMEKITNDMDEVLQDFSNKNITQKTIERQEQILSRMLNNQKSLAQKDFSNDRKSQSGEQFEFTGSEILPDNLGQKSLFLINAMESAMNEGHSNEFNQLIRNYFLNLQKKKANEK